MSRGLIAPDGGRASAWRSGGCVIDSARVAIASLPQGQARSREAVLVIDNLDERSRSDYYEGMFMPDFLDEKRREIAARLKELKPLVDEYARLEAAAAALAGVPTTAPSAPAPSRSRGARHSSAAKAAPRRRGAAESKGRGRPKGTGARAKEALALVKANPGISIPEMAEKMGIKQNYLYRVLPGLADDGMVQKSGRGWLPKDAA